MRAYIVVTLIVLMTLAVALPVSAQSSFEPGESAYAADEGGYLPARTSGPAYLSILDVVGKLILAVLIAYALLHAIRWWQNSQMRGGLGASSGGRLMRIEESLSLGTDGRLYLVEVDGRRMLLAGREDGLMQIADLSEESREPTAYRSVRQRADGSTDELNVVQSRRSTRPVRPDLTDESEQWEQRRNRLLAELQEQD